MKKKIIMTFIIEEDELERGEITTESLQKQADDLRAEKGVIDASIIVEDIKE